MVFGTVPAWLKTYALKLSTLGSHPRGHTARRDTALARAVRPDARWDAMQALEPRVLLSSVTFAVGVDYPTGNSPYSVIAADFNGDGKRDLAVANQGGSDTVSVLLGDGSGGFGAKNDFATGNNPVSVTAADLNGDGKRDLAVANLPNHTVSVLLGDGSGGFGAKTDFAAGDFPRFVIAADFNGDGKSDLAVTNYNSHTVSVLLGNGSGGFGAKTDFDTGDNPWSVIATDFNGDGKLDLAVANEGNAHISVLLGDGSGGFAAETIFDTGVAPISVIAADFNGDGKLDLAVANNSDDTVSVLLGNGSGGFGAKTDFATGAAPESVITADFNGDGKLDLAVANGNSNTVSVLLGNGSGGFGAKTDLATGTNPNTVIAADFNGDGKLDLAVANYNSNTVRVLLNTTVPTDIALTPGVIAENQAVGAVVGTLTTTDPDPGNTYTYSFVTGTGSTDNSRFTITGNTLKTNAVFNYEMQNSYSIRIRATNQGGLTFDKALTVGVTNVNEAPVVTGFPKTTPLNTALGFATSDFSPAFTDPDGDALQRVKITSLPTHGILRLGAVAVTVNQEIAVGTLGTLTYTPTTGYVGPDTIGWKGSDGGLYAATAATVNLTVTIPVVGITATAPNASETNPATTGKGSFTITRDQTSNPLTVNFTLTGTATRGTDYILRKQGTVVAITTGSITFAAGESSFVLEVVPTDDTVAEATETVILAITPPPAWGPASYTLTPVLANRAATVTITDNEPVVSITATLPNASETNPGTAGLGSFTITRDQTSNPLTVNFTLAGTATRGTDYILRKQGTLTVITAGSITFAAGESSYVLEVVPTDDTVAEGTETVILAITTPPAWGPAAYTLTPVVSERAATVTIADNEPVVSITATAPNASETNPATAGLGAFTITRDQTSNPLTVNFTLSGTATRGTDYILRKQGTVAAITAGSITFAAGESSFVLEVLPTDDTVAEGTETVILAITPPPAYGPASYTLTPVLANRSATVTIADNEPVVSITATAPNASETNTSTTGLGSFTLTRDQTSNPLTVNFTLAGTATRGTDYILRKQGTVTVITTGSITFAAGESSYTLEVLPTDDIVAEGTETVILAITPPPAWGPASYTLTPTLANRSATITIADNEPVVSITATLPNASENNPSTTGLGSFTFTRDQTSNPLTVNFTLAGTATRGTDYILRKQGTVAVITTGSITFAAGESTYTLEVVPTDDTVAEGTETVILAITPPPAWGPASYTLTPVMANRTATLTIADNEPVVGVTATAPNASETDPTNVGKGSFTFTRDQTSNPLTVNFTLVGTATRGTDYILRKQGTATVITTGSITFAAGESSYTLEVVPTDDTVAEGTETVILAITPPPAWGPAAYTLTPVVANRTATVSITDNEPVVSITASLPNASETNPATAGLGSFTLTRDQTSNPLTVNFTLAGTAARGTDYILRKQGTATVITTGSITFAAGESSFVLEVVPTDDTVAEAAETVILAITPPPAWGPASYTLTPTLANRSATVTITDNEPVVSITATLPNASETNPATAGLGSFTITRDQTSNPLTVNFTLAGTATRGTDYILRKQGTVAVITTGSITFAAGESSFVLEVVPIDDTVAEAAETVILAITPPPAWGPASYTLTPVVAERSATVTIADNEPVVKIESLADTTEGAAPGTFRITRSNGTTANALVVNFTVAGTATASSDYALSGNAVAASYPTSATIAAGQTYVDIAVTALTDASVETVETVILNLTAHAAYTLDATPANRSATVRITNGDVVPSSLAGKSLTLNGAGTFYLGDNEFIHRDAYGAWYGNYIMVKNSATVFTVYTTQDDGDVHTVVFTFTGATGGTFAMTGVEDGEPVAVNSTFTLATPTGNFAPASMSGKTVTGMATASLDPTVVGESGGLSFGPIMVVVSDGTNAPYTYERATNYGWVYWYGNSANQRLLLIFSSANGGTYMVNTSADYWETGTFQLT